MKRQRKAFTRDERKAMIVQALAILHQKYVLGSFTLAQVANLMGITPQTKLRDMLSELEIAGVVSALDEKTATIRGFTRYYRLVDEYVIYHGKQRVEPRSIKIRGSKNGQQYMFEEWIQ